MECCGYSSKGLCKLCFTNSLHLEITVKLLDIVNISIYASLFLIRNADTDPTNNFKYNITQPVRSVARYGTSITAGGADPLIALQSNSRLNQFVRLENIPTDPTELGPLSPVEIIVSCNATQVYMFRGEWGVN